MHISRRPGLQQIVKAEQFAAGGIAEDGVVLLKTHIQFGRNLVIFSIAPQARLYRPHRITDHTRIPVHRSRGPVAFAHLIQHGATNADAGVGFKAGTFAKIEFAGGFEQADHAGLHKIFNLDAGRQASKQVVGDTFDQRGILLNQAILLLSRALCACIHVQSASLCCHRSVPVGCTRRSTKNSR